MWGSTRSTPSTIGRKDSIRVENYINEQLERRKSKDSLGRSQGSGTPPSEVFPGLWLGNVWTANDVGWLQAHGITHVLNVSPLTTEKVEGVAYHQLEVEDDCWEKIAPYFGDCNKFLSDALGPLTVADVEGKPKVAREAPDAARACYVHCRAGRSRSATVVVAYLMAAAKLSLRDAFRFLQGLRPTIAPNSGFLSELVQYECELRGAEEASVDWSQLKRWCDPVWGEFIRRNSKQAEDILARTDMARFRDQLSQLSEVTEDEKAAPPPAGAGGDDEKSGPADAAAPEEYDVCTMVLKSLDGIEEPAPIPYEVRGYEGEATANAWAQVILENWGAAFLEQTAGASDMRSVAALFVEHYASDAARFDPEGFFIVYDGFVPVGTAFAWAGDTAEEGVMHWVGVSEGYRRKGLATALVNRVLNFHKQKGRTSVGLTTESFREGAIALYARLGFEGVSRVPIAELRKEKGGS